MYDTMALIMEILRIRIHHMSDELKRHFVAGDDNGDGVLSFEEFDSLLHRIAPGFSDRRILRMFREALTGGEENAFAIERGTFAEVCRAHGLVKLVDTEKLEREEEEMQVLEELEREQEGERERERERERELEGEE